MLITAIVNNKGNNIDNLRSPFFEDDNYQQRLDHFKEYYAEPTVRQLFLDGKTSDDVKFNCDYSCGRFEETQMIRYLKYPNAAVEEAATQYWQTHQDDMLLDLYMNEHIKDCLEKLEAKEDSRFHRQRDIIEAVRQSEAKSVKVTIQRDGKDFSFKYPALNLSSNGFTDYQSWDMSAKDRERFSNTFAEDSRFYPAEITSISYRGKAIYEAAPLSKSPSLIARDVIDAVKHCQSDYVYVAVCKDGQAIGFEYPSDNLIYYSPNGYGYEDMSPVDRNEFVDLFGNDGCFKVEDITHIESNGKTIYEAEPFGINETPDEDEGFNMKM